jgi:hypothetical protein
VIISLLSSRRLLPQECPAVYRSSGQSAWRCSAHALSRQLLSNESGHFTHGLPLNIDYRSYAPDNKADRFTSGCGRYAWPPRQTPDPLGRDLHLNNGRTFYLANLNPVDYRKISRDDLFSSSSLIIRTDLVLLPIQAWPQSASGSASRRFRLSPEFPSPCTVIQTFKSSFQQTKKPRVPKHGTGVQSRGPHPNWLKAMACFKALSNLYRG